MNKEFEKFMDNYTNLNYTDKHKFDNYRIIVEGFNSNTELMFGGETLEYVRQICFLNSTIKEEHLLNIKKVSSLYFVNCVLQTQFSLLNTYFVEIKKYDMDILQDNLSFERCNDLKEVSNAFGENLRVYIVNCNNLESFKISNVSRLNVLDCQKFYKMSNIKSDHIKRCSLYNLKVIDECNTIFDYLSIVKCNKIISFSNIHKLKVKDTLVLENITVSNSNNLINVCMCNSRNICLVPTVEDSPNNNNILVDILIKYLRLHDTPEHMMDCALELLDNNFDAAAEL